VSRRPPVALLAATALAASCTGSATPAVAPAVAVTPATGLSAHVRAVCAQVTRSLPREVAAGVGRRVLRPDDATVAAWGDPPVVLRCGVPAGSPRDDPYEFDGVRWALHDTGASRTWTTLGRAVNVEVVVPDAYDGQAELLGGLATALAATAR
jgi:hypothetical protein